MTEPTPAKQTPAKPTVKSELAKAEVEPLLPIEKKLIGWSLGIGIVLLVGLALLNRLYPVVAP